MEHFKHFVYKIWDLTDSLMLFSVSTLLLDLRDGLWIVSLFITISYTLWKWIKEYKETKNKKKGK